MKIKIFDTSQKIFAVRFVLQNMRVFGHFEHPIFLELVKQIEYLTVSTNQHLFKVGDPDENIFIVQSGLVNVYASDPAEVTNFLRLIRR